MLSKQDLMVLNRTGEQLKNVIRNLIREFPKSACSIAGMSNWLGINRSNSQRVLNAVNKSHDGKDVICLAPGTAGMQEFVDLCEAKQIKGVLITEARKALEAFQVTIKQYGRSHSELKRLLTEMPDKSLSDASHSDKKNSRMRHYEAMRDLIGESTDFLFCTYVLTESEKDPSFLKEFALVSKQNIQHSSSARPFFQHYTHLNVPGFRGPEIVMRDSKIGDDQFHVGIAQDYSSPELVHGYSGYSANRSCLVFNNVKNKHNPFDATFVFCNPDEIKNPLNSDTKSSSTAISIKNPTKRLVMMVFMEKKLDMCSSVNVGCYSANNSIPEGQLSVDEIWDDRFPEFPELRIVNQDSPIASGVEGYEYGYLTDFLFRCADLNKKDFVCYLMDVPYPIWSSCYRIYFEHS
ncbi:hypothetical protein [Aliikangiella coralliicola]|uniref:Uncharacterized protein n=1 Tax=Aliikangiella coralliicola TaxID=2592383 RepID=A0A545UA98_9GAMM|nr:hypothetical protein [Aliikangiella coralliicola]TQV86359.1 hypothetical protein FLL46_15670 [Aliikangiella coralliicola]